MLERSGTELTRRQKNELEYHREHARKNAAILNKPFSWDVLNHPSRRWWNAYWQMYAYLSGLNLKDKRVLVVGCGFGDDALRLAKLGADVYAFDLSPDSLSIAKSLAAREGLGIAFAEMPAETLRYESDFFDFIIARDILHHVDIPRTMTEIRRVSRPGALFIVNEIYSHSIIDRIRHSTLVEKILYPRLQRFIYGEGKPYITDDERKLTERDIRAITKSLHSLEFKKYFNFIVTRLVPDRYESLAKIDRILLMILKPVAYLLAGRVLLSGHIEK
ncbi:MAG: class I SAM-dependent methyltransferase [Candidatus Binatia bacterium]